MDGCSPKQRGNILSDIFQGHGWCWILFRRVGELFKSSECICIGEIEHSLMCLDDLKIEGSHLIEEHLIGSKPRSVCVLVVQDLLDGRGCFCHTRSPSERLCIPGWFGHSQHPLLMKNMSASTAMEALREWAQILFEGKKM